MEKTVSVLAIEKIGSIIPRDNGTIVILLELPDGTEVGLMMRPEQADELTGSLIERPESGYRSLGSDEGFHQDVVDHTFGQVEPDACSLKLAGEQGTFLTSR